MNNWFGTSMFKKISLIVVSTFFVNLYPLFPINIIGTFDNNFWVSRPVRKTNFFATMISEGSIGAYGRDTDGTKVNILQIWNKNQDTLAMVRGFSPTSEIGQIATAVGNISNDIDDRGRFLPTADLDYVATGVNLEYRFCNNFSLSAYLPFYYMKLKDVDWESLTKDVRMEDDLVKKGLASNFSSLSTLTKKLGNLDLGGWRSTGIGDVLFFGKYFKDFPQQTGGAITNVRLEGNLGLSVPSGKKKNEDMAFDIPLGNDGAWGLHFGTGIDITWHKYIRGGGYIQFLQLFGTTKERRIKVDADQTDLLFLAKCRAYKDYGFTQSYNLFLELATRPVCLRVAYQHMKHAEDRLSLFSNSYSSDIANTATSLEGWTNHQLLFKATFDFLAGRKLTKNFYPTFDVFYKKPFNGKNMTQVHTFGGALTIEF
jgi:hypothetical protein